MTYHEPIRLRVTGVGRDAEYPKSIVVYLNRLATDDEIHALHDHVSRFRMGASA